MTFLLRHGRLQSRLAEGAVDLAACQRLRHLGFQQQAGYDVDRFDPFCDHLMIEDGGRLLATCRVMHLNAETIGQSYAAVSYDMECLRNYPEPMMELGRVCLHPELGHPDVLRLLWGAITEMADTSKAGLIFGCASFPGLDPAPYARGLLQLWDRHPAPKALCPARKKAERIDAATLAGATGRAPLPSLLRSYLGLGAWVGDHAVLDHELNTFHLFVGLEVSKVPPRRSQALRSLRELARA